MRWTESTKFHAGWQQWCLEQDGTTSFSLLPSGHINQSFGYSHLRLWGSGCAFGFTQHNEKDVAAAEERLQHAIADLTVDGVVQNVHFKSIGISKLHETYDKAIQRRGEALLSRDVLRDAGDFSIKLDRRSERLDCLVSIDVGVVNGDEAKEKLASEGPPLKWQHVPEVGMWVSSTHHMHGPTSNDDVVRLWQDARLDWSDEVGALANIRKDA